MTMYKEILIELRNLRIKTENIETDIKNLEIKLIEILERIETNTNIGITYND